MLQWGIIVLTDVEIIVIMRHEINILVPCSQAYIMRRILGKGRQPPLLPHSQGVMSVPQADNSNYASGGMKFCSYIVYNA